MFQQLRVKSNKVLTLDIENALFVTFIHLPRPISNWTIYNFVNGQFDALIPYKISNGDFLPMDNVHSDALCLKLEST